MKGLELQSTITATESQHIKEYFEQSKDYLPFKMPEYKKQITTYYLLCKLFTFKKIMFNFKKRLRD